MHPVAQSPTNLASLSPAQGGPKDEPLYVRGFDIKSKALGADALTLRGTSITRLALPSSTGAYHRQEPLLQRAEISELQYAVRQSRPLSEARKRTWVCMNPRQGRGTRDWCRFTSRDPSGPESTELEGPPGCAGKSRSSNYAHRSAAHLETPHVPAPRQNSRNQLAPRPVRACREVYATAKPRAARSAPTHPPGTAHTHRPILEAGSCAASGSLQYLSRPLAYGC